MATLLVVLVLALAEVPAGWLLVGPSVAFTLLHTGEEVFGRGGPFWVYYRERFGRGALEYPTGLALFAGLAAMLIGLAVGGYVFGSMLLLWGLIGARWGDAWLSHAGLRLVFAGRNPGLRTAPLYVAESVLAALLFPFHPAGFALGFGAFAAFWVGSFALRSRS